MEIASGVHHFTKYKFNWYVVDDGGRLTVIDTGFPGHYRLFRAGLRSMGRNIGDVDAIVITHAHADHTGFAPRLSRASGAPIYVHAADVELVRHPLHLPWGGLLTNAWRPYTASMLGHAVAHGLFRMRTIRSPKPMQDQDLLDIPGRPLVVHVPGHTPGDVVVHLTERGVLFSGDALVTRDLFTGKNTPPQVTSPMLNANYREAVQHLNKVENLGPVTLLPGHGRPWTGDARDAVAAASEAAVEKRRSRHPG